MEHNDKQDIGTYRPFTVSQCYWGSLSGLLTAPFSCTEIRALLTISVSLGVHSRVRGWGCGLVGIWVRLDAECG